MDKVLFKHSLTVGNEPSLYRSKVSKWFKKMAWGRGNGNRIVQMLIWFSHEIQVEIKKLPIIQVCKDTIYKDMFSFEYFNKFIH